MKISGFILVVLMVGLGFGLVGSIVNDFETQYPNVSVGENFSKYDYSEEINTETSLLQSAIEYMQDENAGWILKALVGVLAVPVAIFTAIGTVLTSMKYGLIIFTDVASTIFKVPSFIISTVTVMIIVIVLFAILSWWHRSKA